MFLRWECFLSTNIYNILLVCSVSNPVKDDNVVILFKEDLCISFLSPTKSCPKRCVITVTNPFGGKNARKSSGLNEGRAVWEIFNQFITDSLKTSSTKKQPRWRLSHCELHFHIFSLRKNHDNVIQDPFKCLYLRLRLTLLFIIYEICVFYILFKPQFSKEHQSC